MSGGEYQKARKLSFKLPAKYADLFSTFDTLTRYWWDYLDHKRHWAMHEAGKSTKTVTLWSAAEEISPGVFVNWIQINCRDSNVFRFTMVDDFEFREPLNPIDGQVINVRFKQNVTGGHVCTFDTKVKVTGTIDAAGDAVSILSMQYDSLDDRWEGVISTGFA